MAAKQTGVAVPPPRLRFGILGAGAPRAPRERIYIIPTIPGAILASFVLALFGGAYFLQGFGGPAQVLVIALAVAGIVALIETNGNLRGLGLRFHRAEPTPDGLEIEFEVAVTNSSTFPRYGFRIVCRERLRRIGAPAAIPKLEPGETRVVTLALPARTRGLHPLPPVWVESIFPAGLCFSWKSFLLPPLLVVYPRPESRGGPSFLRGRESAEDVTGHRPYEPGDAPSRIDWKAYARSQKLAVRAIDPDSEAAVKWEETEGDTETRLRQLSARIDECLRAGAKFRLELPGSTIPGHDPVACRTALARFRS